MTLQQINQMRARVGLPMVHSAKPVNRAAKALANPLFRSRVETNRKHVAKNTHTFA